MHKGSRGFTVVEVALLVIIAGILGFTGWYVLHTKNNAYNFRDTDIISGSKKSSSNSSTNQPSTQSSFNQTSASPKPEEFKLNNVVLHEPYEAFIPAPPSSHDSTGSNVCHISATLYANGAGLVTFEWSEYLRDPAGNVKSRKFGQESVNTSAPSKEIENNGLTYRISLVDYKTSYYSLQIFSPIQASYQTAEKSWCGGNYKY